MKVDKTKTASSLGSYTDENGSPAPKSRLENMVPEARDAAKDLRDLFIDALQEIYGAAKADSSALPPTIANASSQNLINILNDQQRISKLQISRLQEVFVLLGEEAAEKKCEAVQVLLDETQSIIKHTQQGAVRDAAIISTAQKKVHYQIACYGTLAAFARTLQEHQALDLITQNLAEEKRADKLLTKAAGHNINFEASDQQLDQQ